MARGRLQDSHLQIQVFQVEGTPAPFIPWKRGERGSQTLVKLTRGEESGFLMTGASPALDGQIQQGLMRLVNEGWHVEGEVTLSFEGKAEPGTDPYVYQDPLVLELSQALLPLVDPQQGAPILARIPGLRDEIARESGLISAGIRVQDNLELSPGQYVLRIKGAPAASGEIFLDRLLAIGDLEQLGALQGWSTIEPSFRVPAKWIQAEEREQAAGLGCLLLGALQVLLTHLKQTILTWGPDLLGLQETHDLVGRLAPSHPVVVEEFLQDRSRLRALRQVLRALLSERVPIRDLVTILEVVGESLDRGLRVEPTVERCRRALSRQICWGHLNQEGILRALVLAPEAEQRLMRSLEPGEEGMLLRLGPEEVEDLLAGVRLALDQAGSPPVLFTDPPTRLMVRRVLATGFPTLAVLSTAELAPGVRLETAGQVHFKSQARPPQDGLAPTAGAAPPPAQEPSPKREGVFGFLRGT